MTSNVTHGFRLQTIPVRRVNGFSIIAVYRVEEPLHVCSDGACSDLNQWVKSCIRARVNRADSVTTNEYVLQHSAGAVPTGDGYASSRTLFGKTESTQPVGSMSGP